MVQFSYLMATLLLIFSISLSSALNSDGLALLALKAAVAADPERVLVTWKERDETPCGWPSVTCTHRRVTGLALSRRGLSGYIPSELGAILSLQRLSLSGNNFSRPVPPRLFNATSLVYLDLSHNILSGPLPSEIKTLKKLTHLDLSSNLLDGFLPESIRELSSLDGTLNLSYNRFSGNVPASFGDLPVKVSLDFRHNNLSGKIPQVGSLLNQGPTAFTDNPGLCGFPLEAPCSGDQTPGLGGDPENPKPLKTPNATAAHSGQSRRKAGEGEVTAILISAAAVALGAVSVFAWLVRKKGRILEGKTRKRKLKQEEDDDDGEDTSEGRVGKFGTVDEEFGLALEDLLRASAYVMGKGTDGIVYKVVAGGGSAMLLPPRPPLTVAVRRLSETADGAWRFKDFEAEVHAIGMVRHPNIVPLRAYYYAHDEKLLISDFIPNGSLFNALHCRPPSALPPLTWASRLKIAQGVARGLMHIHECGPRKYVHGNLKSSKILLDSDFRAYISSFGLTRLASKPTNSSSKKQNCHQYPTPVLPFCSKKPSSSEAYIAPEARFSGSRLGQECDVYSYGIVLLEILTGRLPEAASDHGMVSLVRRVLQLEQQAIHEIADTAIVAEVQGDQGSSMAEITDPASPRGEGQGPVRRQVVAAFHLALDCTELGPALRPSMRSVSEALDRIKFQ